MARIIYCNACQHATAIYVMVPLRCHWCGQYDPGWRSERVPWRLTRADVVFLKVNRIDPEVTFPPVYS